MGLRFANVAAHKQMFLTGAVRCNERTARIGQAGLAGVLTAQKTMTGVHQLEQNQGVYSVEGADAVI